MKDIFRLFQVFLTVVCMVAITCSLFAYMEYYFKDMDYFLKLEEYLKFSLTVTGHLFAVGVPIIFYQKVMNKVIEEI